MLPAAAAAPAGRKTMIQLQSAQYQYEDVWITQNTEVGQPVALSKKSPATTNISDG
jgi:hypothetical protein